VFPDAAGLNAHPFALERLRELRHEHLVDDNPKTDSRQSDRKILKPLELRNRIRAPVLPQRIRRHRCFSALERTTAHGKFPRQPRTGPELAAS